MMKPIKTEQDYDTALVRIDALMNAEANTPEADELEVLSMLVERYEAEHYPMPSPSAVDMIKFRMEQMGLEAKDLTPILGSRSKVSEVLNHKRRLSLTMIRNLHQQLAIPLEPLVLA